MTMTSQFAEITSSSIFWCCFASVVNFSYWSSKFHVNIITGSGNLTIFFCKGLTRNPKIGYTLVWVLPNIWRLGRVRDTKFRTKVSNEMSLKAAKCQGYKKNARLGLRSRSFKDIVPKCSEEIIFIFKKKNPWKHVR